MSNENALELYHSLLENYQDYDEFNTFEEYNKRINIEISENIIKIFYLYEKFNQFQSNSK